MISTSPVLYHGVVLLLSMYVLLPPTGGDYTDDIKRVHSHSSINRCMRPPLSATPLSHIPARKKQDRCQPSHGSPSSLHLVSYYARVEQALTSDRLSSTGSLSGCRSLVNRVPACFTIRPVESVCLIHCCSCSPFINDPWNRSSTRGRHPKIHVDVSEF